MSFPDETTGIGADVCVGADTRADTRAGAGAGADTGAGADLGAVSAFRPVPDVLAHLAGEWRVERTVRDLTDGSEGRFTGTVLFSPLPAPDTGGLLHHESGTFTWHGTARPAERTLRFLPGEERGTARVEFADGRFFHDLDLRTGSWTADHPCVRDLYRGEFEVTGSDSWRTRWRVGGPAKDLLLVTEYRRTRRLTGCRAPSSSPGSPGP